jgi:hypothetical protein
VKKIKCGDYFISVGEKEAEEISHDLLPTSLFFEVW